MWNYEKRLQYPINIKNCNPTLAAMIISQYGGPDGELGASMRYLSQRYSMPYREVAGLLTDIGTEELGHLEMVSTMVHQLTRNLTMEQIKGTPFEAYYVDHTVGVWPQAAGGVPFCAIEFQSKGDAITDIAEDMAAEQKARSTYDNLLRLCRDNEMELNSVEVEKENLLKGAKIIAYSGYFNDNEKPERIVDGDVDTKWCEVGSALNYVDFDLDEIRAFREREDLEKYRKPKAYLHLKKD